MNSPHIPIRYLCSKMNTAQSHSSHYKRSLHLVPFVELMMRAALVAGPVKVSARYEMLDIVQSRSINFVLFATKAASHGV